MICSEKFVFREKKTPKTCAGLNASKRVGVGKGLAWENLLARSLGVGLSLTQLCLCLEFSTGASRGTPLLRNSFRRCGLEEDQENGLGAAFPPLLFQDGCASGFQRKWKE